MLVSDEEHNNVVFTRCNIITRRSVKTFKLHASLSHCEKKTSAPINNVNKWFSRSS